MAAQAVRIAAFAIDGKGDADAPEQRLGLGLFHLAQLGRHGRHPVLQPRIGRAHRMALIHLVKIAGHNGPRSPVLDLS